MTKNLTSKIFVREEDKFIPTGDGLDHDANNSNHGEEQKHTQHSQQQHHHQHHHHQQQLPISNHYNVNL